MGNSRNLDATENWTGMKQAEGGASWTLEQARTANPVNEITSITNAVGPTWAEPAYDPAGNMTTIPQSADPETSFTATWDAWNRLVKLLDDDTATTVAEYLYDATNRRILKKLYASGVLDQTRHIYLSSSNQVLEERVGAATAASMQNVWGLMYIDGLVLRDRDTDGNGTLDERLYCLQDGNWNAVALVDTSGDVTQRFCYQPFGTCEFLTSSYSVGANAAYWTTLFTGRELDIETLLYYLRARYLVSPLGAFLRRDPIGYRGGPSLYPLYRVGNGTDPMGLLTPRQFWDSWSDSQRSAWFAAFMAKYEADIRAFAIKHCVPKELLAAVIANEQIDYSSAESFGEWMGLGNSVGPAQLTVPVAIKYNLFPQCQLSRYNGITTTDDVGLSGNSYYYRPEALQYQDIRGNLINPEKNIEASARLLRIYLDILCAKSCENINAGGGPLPDDVLTNIAMLGYSPRMQLSSEVGKRFMSELCIGSTDCQSVVNRDVSANLISLMSAMFNDTPTVLDASNPNVVEHAKNAMFLDGYFGPTEWNKTCGR